MTKNKEYKIIDMPQLCFGLVNHMEDNFEKNLIKAIDKGYRHFDGAEASTYGHKSLVKKAFSKIERADFWLTWKSERISFTEVEKIIKELECEYIDLFLIHFSCGEKNDYDELNRCRKEGLIRFWGVSNCEVYSEIKKLKTNHDIYANQIQARPPGGEVIGRKKLDEDFVKNCNDIGVKIMLFGTNSGVSNGIFTNSENSELFDYFIDEQNKQFINKYYKQKYINQQNGNVLIVSSAFGTSIDNNYDEFYNGENYLIFLYLNFIFLAKLIKDYNKKKMEEFESNILKLILSRQ